MIFFIWEVPHENSIKLIEISSDGSRVVSSDESGRINIWDISLNKCIATFIVYPFNISSILISASGSYVGSVYKNQGSGIFGAKKLNIWNVDNKNKITD